jgi:hypothetical protein
LAVSTPAKLIEFIVRREGEVDTMVVKFSLDARPDVVFVYKRPILDAAYAPELSAESAVSVLFGSILERIAKAPGPIDGVVNLTK